MRWALEGDRGKERQEGSRNWATIGNTRGEKRAKKYTTYIQNELKIMPKCCKNDVQNGAQRGVRLGRKPGKKGEKGCNKATKRGRKGCEKDEIKVRRAFRQ